MKNRKIHENVKITVVVENTAGRSDLLGEHGLSFWIETSAARILFDAGRAIAFRHNTEALNIPLEKADAIVLSHGHYDHTGGLAWALQAADKARIFLHQDALQTRFSLSGGQAHAVDMPVDTRNALRKSAKNTVRTIKPVEIAEGVFVTGPIPRVHELEDTGGPFFLDAGGLTADPIRDDQALWLEISDGLVVVLGCAHAGVINTLDYIRGLAGGTPVTALLGGMHLKAASAARLDWTVSKIRGINLRFLAPMHCTGMSATVALWNASPGACRAAGAGACFEL